MEEGISEIREALVRSLDMSRFMDCITSAEMFQLLQYAWCRNVAKQIIGCFQQFITTSGSCPLCRTLLLLQ